MPRSLVLRSWFAWILFIVGCAEPEPPQPPDDDPLESLRAESGVAWRAVIPDGAQSATMIDGPPLRGAREPSERVVGQSVARAREFLLRHPAVLGNALQTATLEVRDVAADPLGGARVRFAVRVGGLPVESGDVLVVFAPSGEVRAAAGALPGASALAATPVVSAAAAGETAVNAVAASAPDAELDIESAAELVAYDAGGALRPAWRVTVAGGDDDAPIRREVFVDAASGAVFHEREGLLAVSARGSGLDVHGRRRALDIFHETSGIYDLFDEAHHVRTYTAQGSGRSAGVLIRSDAPDRWDEDVFGAGAAVDAHANAGEALDYLATTFRRSSLDGRGTLTRIVVHAGDRLDNAFWDGRHAVFGDGDGDTMLPLSAGLDVVAHELFHGVTQSESKLVYEGEPGALNESLSDVFGCLVELDRSDGNWTIGEAVATQPLRDLAEPERTRNPAHMSQYVRLPMTPESDMGGVHVNSTIPSHAAYLVAVGGKFPRGGGTVTGIGDAKMRDIWWRAATTYLGPRARFADFAEATRVAAEDLYGQGGEVETVEAAWRAVGVVR